MLETINKMSETTQRGDKFWINSPNMSIPSMEPLRNLGIAHCGMAGNNAPYKLVRGDNEPLHYILLYIIKGEVEFETNLGDFYARPGDVICMPSNIDRRLELVKGDQYEEMWFKLTDTASCDTLKNKNLVVRSSSVHKTLKSAFKGYVKETLKNDIFAKHSAHLYAEIMAINLQREVQQDKSNKHGSYQEFKFKKLWENVSNSLENFWNVEKMASMMSTSPSHLFKLTEKYYKQSPMAYVTQLRMEKVKLLLINTDYKLHALSQAVGYANEYTFSVAFTKYTGIRPGAFRKRGIL